MSLTTEQIDIMKRALRRTWETIASDLGVAIRQENPKQHSLPTREVINVVLDADYVLFHGGVDEELYRTWMTLPHGARSRIAKEVFGTFKTWEV